jgi:hypothetical protein
MGVPLSTETAATRLVVSAAPTVTGGGACPLQLSSKIALPGVGTTGQLLLLASAERKLEHQPTQPPFTGGTNRTSKPRTALGLPTTLPDGEAASDQDAAPTAKTIAATTTDTNFILRDDNRRKGLQFNGFSASLASV